MYAALARSTMAPSSSLVSHTRVRCPLALTAGTAAIADTSKPSQLRDRPPHASAQGCPPTPTQEGGLARSCWLAGGSRSAPAAAPKTGATAGGPAPPVTNIKHRISLSRFRTSCHDLRIERERYLPEPIRAPCHMRTRLQCASPAVEDETHMVFHCPIYDCLRFEYADLFPPNLPEYIPCFLSQDQKRVASFIHDCSVLRRRNACMSLAGSESAL